MLMLHMLKSVPLSNTILSTDRRQLYHYPEKGNINQQYTNEKGKYNEETEETKFSLVFKLAYENITGRILT